jgi:hypothetical protein
VPSDARGDVTTRFVPRAVPFQGNRSVAATKRKSGACDVFARYLWSEASALPEEDWHYDDGV